MAAHRASREVQLLGPPSCLQMKRKARALPTEMQENGCDSNSDTRGMLMKK